MITAPTAAILAAVNAVNIGAEIAMVQPSFRFSNSLRKQQRIVSQTNETTNGYTSRANTNLIKAEQIGVALDECRTLSGTSVTRVSPSTVTNMIRQVTD